MEGFRDEAGLFGVAGGSRAAYLVCLGLHALQHRGASGAGIVAADKELLRVHRGAGAAGQVFDGQKLQELSGSIAIGQVVGGDGERVLSQGVANLPLFARYRGGQVALAFAGRLTNGFRLREELKRDGALFATGHDAEVVLHLMARSSQRTPVNRFVDALWQVEGAYAALLCTPENMVAVRDPRGFRPLVMGTRDGATVVASEDAALRFIGAQVDRELQPGEMLVIERSGHLTVSPFPRRARAACLHELIALALDDSRVFGHQVYRTRSLLGEQLAHEHRAAGADVVVAMPGSEAAAVGFSRASRLPVEPGLRRSPDASEMEDPGDQGGTTLRNRTTVVDAAVAGRKLVLVLRTLAQVGTLAGTIAELRRAGAAQVHLRVASPPVRRECSYGVRSVTTDELAIHRHGTLAELEAALGADSLAFLSLAGVREAVRRAAGSEKSWCEACFSGDQPLAVEESDEQLGLF